jgi:hypothetical protein
MYVRLEEKDCHQEQLEDIIRDLQEILEEKTRRLEEKDAHQGHLEGTIYCIHLLL